MKKQKINKKIRFGDVIKQELQNPDSITSQAVRKLNAWKMLVKTNPKRYCLYTEYGKINFSDRKDTWDNISESGFDYNFIKIILNKYKEDKK